MGVEQDIQIENETPMENESPPLFVLDLNDILPSVEDVQKFAILVKNKETLIRVLADEKTDAKMEELEELCVSLDISFDDVISSFVTMNLFYLASSGIELGECE